MYSIALLFSRCVWCPHSLHFMNSKQNVVLKRKSKHFTTDRNSITLFLCDQNEIFSKYLQTKLILRIPVQLLTMVSSEWRWYKPCKLLFWAKKNWVSITFFLKEFFGYDNRLWQWFQNKLWNSTNTFNLEKSHKIPSVHFT